jgi:hypothetical protein
LTEITVVRRDAEFGDTNRGARCAEAVSRGIVSVSVPVRPDSGVVVATDIGGAALEPAPPPLHAAIPLATRRRTEPNATARVFIVMTPLWQIANARIPRAAYRC